MNPPQMEDFAQESQQATQLMTQNEEVEQSFAAAISNAYARLTPCNPALNQIDLLRTKDCYAFGRGPQNDVQFPGLKISFTHCKISWNGRDDDGALIQVQDSSTNGTWINGVRLEKGHSRVLRDGNEIAFGTPMEQPNPKEDYRYIFRQFTGSHKDHGLNAVYDLTHELGKGSFATVMKALHRPTGQYYAVKIIHGSKIRGGDEAKVQAFMREISILESLSHPNICTLKERFCEQTDENIYLVLELVDGGDLLDYILDNKGIGEARSRHITRQICTALSYIHSKGVTHRDLKPENILLTKDDPPIVKVADFGLAKVVDQLTMLRTMCGTPSYLAPEVVTTPTGHGYDHLVDSWSVGVIVFSMLTSNTPFIENENLPIPQRIATRTIDWSILNERHLSLEARDFIRRLLDPDPSTRLSLTDALNHPWLINPEPVDTLPDGEPSQVTSDTGFSNLAEDISMFSSFPSMSDMGPPAPPPQLMTNRLERRSVVLARQAEEVETAARSQAGRARSTASDQSDELNAPTPVGAAGVKRARDGPANGNGNGNGHGMEAIGEEESLENLAFADTASNADDGNGEARLPKRGRMMDVDGAAGVSQGKGPIRVMRLSAAAAEEVRRSPRNVKTRR